MTNGFETYAETAKPAFERRREATAAKAAATRAKSKEEAEQELLDKLYRAGNRQRHAELLAGPYGADIKDLIKYLKRLTMESAGDLVGHIDRAAWIHAAPEPTRYEILKLINRGMSRLAAKEGYPDGFDDAFWDEPPRAFAIIRKRLGVR